MIPALASFTNDANQGVCNLCRLLTIPFIAHLNLGTYYPTKVPFCSVIKLPTWCNLISFRFQYLKLNFYLNAAPLTSRAVFKVLAYLLVVPRLSFTKPIPTLPAKWIFGSISNNGQSSQKSKIQWTVEANSWLTLKLCSMHHRQ